MLSPRFNPCVPILIRLYGAPRVVACFRGIAALGMSSGVVCIVSTLSTPLPCLLIRLYGAPRVVACFHGIAALGMSLVAVCHRL